MGSSTSQSKSRVFDEEGVSLFRELFKDMIQRSAKIEQRVVAKRLKQNGHGQLHGKYTKQKVADKNNKRSSLHTYQAVEKVIRYIQTNMFSLNSCNTMTLCVAMWQF